MNKNRFISHLLSTISSFSMIADRDHILVALSGGADSVALLAAMAEMAEIAPRFNLTLSVAHVNHGIRGPEADRDATFAEKTTAEVAKRYGIKIPFYLHRADVKKIAKEQKLSTQEAGRLVRDTFFRDLMKKTGATKIATGHTGSDNAETLVMRLIVGAGPEGLSGIPPVRLPYVRPLINTTRSEIEAYLAERDIPWIVDSTNLKNDYLRNRIRNEIIPALTTINPSVERSLNQAVAAYRDAFGALKSAAGEFMERHAAEDWLDVRGLSGLSPGLLSEVVKLLIFRKAHNRPTPLRLTRRHIDAVMNLIIAPPGGTRTVMLPGGLVARRVYDNLVIKPAPARGSPGPVDAAEFSLPVSGETVISPWGAVVTTLIGTNAPADVAISAHCVPGAPAAIVGDPCGNAMFDADLVGSPLVVRTRRPGDRISLPGGAGTKKLSDLFIDAKAPRELRDRIILVASGDDILWVVGWAVDRRFAVTEKTRRVLTVTFRPART